MPSFLLPPFFFLSSVAAFMDFDVLAGGSDEEERSILPLSFPLPLLVLGPEILVLGPGETKS